MSGWVVGLVILSYFAGFLTAALCQAAGRASRAEEAASDELLSFEDNYGARVTAHNRGMYN